MPAATPGSARGLRPGPGRRRRSAAGPRSRSRSACGQSRSLPHAGQGRYGQTTSWPWARQACPGPAFRSRQSRPLAGVSPYRAPMRMRRCPAFSRARRHGQGGGHRLAQLVPQEFLARVQGQGVHLEPAGHSARGHRREGRQVEGQRLPAAGARADDHPAAVAPRPASRRSTGPRPAGTGPGPGPRSGPRPRRACSGAQPGSCWSSSRLAWLEMSRLG